ncbi:MAG: hypothetical protein HKN07_07700 [Acidimicrobiia bacterium]|nr:hypothetical protein [Acidimicrobiia bacterium]NNF64130.1 hypothetical protein [Acidimicrobiia bacterium]
MHHIQVMEASVRAGKMPEFVHAVQHWERLALDDPDAPEYHAVYVGEADPHRLLVVTQFRDRATASRFTAAGLFDTFEEKVRHLLADVPQRTPFDLFYAAGSEGTNVIFGEDTSTPH